MRTGNPLFFIDSPLDRHTAARLTLHREWSDMGRREVDPNAECQVVDSGIWVQCWVLVPTEDVNDTIRAEQEREG